MKLNNTTIALSPETITKWNQIETLKKFFLFIIICFLSFAAFANDAIKVSFSAKWENKKTSLTWTAENEKGLSHYTIERSINGAEFKEIALVFTSEDPSVQSQHIYSDNVKALANAVINYRLKMVSSNGSYYYSSTCFVSTSDATDFLPMTTYPNPVSNEIKITIPGLWKNKEVNYTIYNQHGHVVKQLTNAQANQTETILIAELSAGTYTVQASNSSTVAVKQFVKI